MLKHDAVTLYCILVDWSVYKYQSELYYAHVVTISIEVYIYTVYHGKN